MTDDLIKRSDAIEMLQEAIMAYPPVMKGCGETRDSTLEEAINLILDIPSADRPQGEWIIHFDDLFPEDSSIECPVCHEEQPMGIDDNYCPNCGCRMKGADDE